MMQAGRPLRHGLSVLLIASIPTAMFAADGDRPEEPGHAALDEVTIIGHRRDPADIPGSAHVVGQEELQTFLQSDVMRVLRTVPGVYIQEEEGFGLRPNIGIRGSGLDRSARVALLEDGVLIAPAPYAAPSAYYFPTQRRMHALEVLKGPSSVAVGPKTTGGAINLISTPIPDQFSASADLRIGQHNTFDTHLNMGNRGERFSFGFVNHLRSLDPGVSRRGAECLETVRSWGGAQCSHSSLSPPKACPITASLRPSTDIRRIDPRFG